MAVAQGINKQLAIIKQSALGTLGAGAGSQSLRRVTSQFNKNRDTYENNEIVSHQQSTGATHGLIKPNGKINGLLSPATYKLLFAGLLRKDFAAGAIGTSQSHTIAAGAGATWTITRTTGWLAEFFKIGDVITSATAGFNAANKNKNLLIVGLTATVATVVALNGVALVAEGPIASSVFSVVGKKTLAPLTGHTNDYFTIEEWYSDLSKSELFGDFKPAKADISLPASGNATVNFDMVGLQRVLGTAQVLTSPTAVTTGNVLTAIQGVVWVNGVATTLTGVSLSIDGSTSNGEGEIGSNSSSDLQRGRIKVTGSFTALFKDTLVQAIYEATSVIQLVVVLADGSAAAAPFIAFNLSAIKIFGDDDDDGEKQLIRTYPFTAQIDANGGAALATDNTILSIQDSAA